MGDTRAAYLLRMLAKASKETKEKRKRREKRRKTGRKRKRKSRRHHKVLSTLGPLKSFSRRCLVKIGRHIDLLLAPMSDDKAREWRSHLWFFVSNFTEFDAMKLFKLYRHAVKKENEGGGGGGGERYHHQGGYNGHNGYGGRGGGGGHRDK